MSSTETPTLPEAFGDMKAAMVFGAAQYVARRLVPERPQLHVVRPAVAE